MITVNDIYIFLNEMAPFDNKCFWDNCGLLVGSMDAQVKKIGFTLDLTKETLKYAKEKGVDLVVTHHPVIFKAQKSFLKGNIAYETAMAGISVISAHTCYDCAKEGVSKILADTLGLQNLEAVETEEGPSCVLIGDLLTDNLMNSRAFGSYVSERLNAVLRFSEGDRCIKRVAVCGGSGGDFVYNAVAAGADAYVTGDLSHQHFLVAQETGMTVIAAGHFETENPSILPLMNKVCGCFTEIEGIYLEQRNPVEYIK